MNISQAIVLYVMKTFRLLRQNGFENSPKNSTLTRSKKLVYRWWHCIIWEGTTRKCKVQKQITQSELYFTLLIHSDTLPGCKDRNMEAILLKHPLYKKHCNPGAWQSCKLHKCIYGLKGTLTELRKAVPEESWIYATKTVQLQCPTNFPQKTQKKLLFLQQFTFK